MSKNHILVFETLKKAIDNLADEQASFLYLNSLIERAIKNAKNPINEFEVDKISRAELHAITYNTPLDEIDKERVKRNLNIESFKKFLINLISNNQELQVKFKDLGFYPVIKNSEGKGRGNERKIWLDIDVYDENIFGKENQKEIIDKSTIKYDRQENSLVKISLFSKIFFDKNYELKMMSFKGILLLFILINSFFINLIIIALLFVSIFIIYEFLKIGSIITPTLIFLSLFMFSYFMYNFYIPLNKIQTHRIVKAPQLFKYINHTNAEIEFFGKEKDYKYNIARITEIRAVCPICTAPILLMDGKPDQSAPLVGRCIEAPHAHVYSFDRVMMVGYFLGHPMYLQEDQLESD